MSHERGRPPQAGRTLVFASANHVWSDLFFALLIPLLPLIRQDPNLDLTFTEAALLKSVWTGSSAVLQVPVGYLADGIGEFWMIVGGNLWVAAGLLVMASVSGFWLLLAVTLAAGLGGGTQHPLATSIVSKAFDDSEQATAVGTVNFSGDLGKMAAPAIALAVATHQGWRSTLRVVGGTAITFMAASMFFRRSVDIAQHTSSDDEALEVRGDSMDTAGFLTLSFVGFLDSGVRGATLAFLPFLMEDKGMSEPQMFGMLILMLAGGAAGKLACGRLADRIGTMAVIWSTKGLAAVLIFVAPQTPTLVLLPLIVILGFGLNGTSSVLYATVASFVSPHRRSRMYGYFYTTNEGGGFVMPLVIGRIADLASLRYGIGILAFATALILPTSLPLRHHLKHELPRRNRTS